MGTMVMERLAAFKQRKQAGQTMSPADILNGVMAAMNRQDRQLSQSRSGAPVFRLRPTADAIIPAQRSSAQPPLAQPSVKVAKPRHDQDIENPFPPPAEALRILRIGEAPAVRDFSGKPVAGGSLAAMFYEQAGLCCYCGDEMTLPPPGLRKGHGHLTDAELTAVNTTCVTRDHIAPKSQGNPGRWFNYAAACRLCNEQKGDMPLLTFILGRATGKLGEYRQLYRKTQKNHE